ncbi:hypothetical protein BTM25_22270 [Actinomadura rubteroloni]|uniref:Double-GTPase 2 domain-containing protein n=1 Tax=Actinomadura rubteroloni TaxID=1926885 RepID=A0A2P4URY0_9ACTN|nr:hypothetical protein [Actinomadura rubteroloni]POM27805.1 hypothetical protein BTM25_22270 [Actinomadura rubteroloni]
MSEPPAPEVPSKIEGPFLMPPAESDRPAPEPQAERGAPDPSPAAGSSGAAVSSARLPHTAQEARSSGPQPVREPAPARGRAKREPGPADGPAGRKMTCPYCLSDFDWNKAPLVDRDEEGVETPLRPEPGESDARWRTRTMHAWRICDVTGEDHYIPASLGGMKPLIIGLVGKTSSGKSHLLAAMMKELENAALKITHRLNVLPLDARLQRTLTEKYQLGLLNDRRVLPRTFRGTPEFTCAYRVTSGHTGEQYALLVFDVAGEIFTAGETAAMTPFMAVADALIFVADGADLDVRPGAPVADPGFTAVLTHVDQVRARGGQQFLPVPAALVVAKSDKLRTFPEVDRWIARDDDLDLTTVEQESEDAYAFLRARGAGSWLAPVQECSDATLHFASATGVDPEDGEYPERSFRRQRVLRPLLALLAMRGVLPRRMIDPEAS